METPNLLRGEFYETSRISKCPRCHLCLVSKKCQNYDPHSLECEVCENRVSPNYNIGGYIPEAEYIPDLQHSIVVIQQAKRAAFAHPDAEGQSIDIDNVTQKHNNIHKAIEQLANFSSMGKLQLEETIERIAVNPEMKELLGRIE